MTAHIEIRHTDADQPFHLRIVGANGEPILSGENLARFEDAEAAVLAVAALFVPEPVLREHWRGGDDPFITTRDKATGCRVKYVDTRAGSEPTC